MKSTPVTNDTVREWLIEQIAAYVDLPPEEIDADTSVVEYGVDSMYKMELTVAIEDEYGASLDPKLLRGEPTVNGITDVICAQATGETPHHVES